MTEFTANWESKQILAQLRASIAVGGVNLDAMLQRIVEAARLLTVANGAAIALQQDKYIVCRARAGEIAPDLSSRLDKSSGISGECLRSGKALCCDDAWEDSRVNAEACRHLGLRSLAAAPIGKSPTPRGILEAFSAQPHAFGDSEMSLLEELAELVSAAMQSRRPFALRLKLANTPRSFSIGKFIVAGVAVLALVVWLTVRKAPERPNLPAAGSTRAPQAESSPAVADSPPDERVLVGEVSSETKPSAGVVMASKIANQAAIAEGVSNIADKPDRPLLNVPAPHSPPPQSPDESTPVPPSVAILSGSSDKEIAGMLSGSSVVPSEPMMRLSQGISGGALEDKVNPVYPTAALMQRRQGRVTLDAVVAEDGRLQNLRVVKGDPMLARAAMEAVSQWRYQPYKLNGEPIKRATTITLVFKLPN
ncbi:MAG TPA: TonB family protein [Terriglobales bacterium]|nr:TonB family protein [Terriglobales bacterium]